MIGHKNPWKIASALLLSAVVIWGALGAAIIHSQAFRNWALRRIIQSVEQKTGTRPSVQSFELRFFPFLASFNGVVARGNEEAQAEALFQAQQIRISVRLLPLLRGDVQIDQIILEKPRIVIRSDRNGKTNLPAGGAPEKGSGLQVAVHFAQIKDGSVRYNDLQIPLTAEVYDLQAQLARLPMTATYRGELRYGHGRILARELNALDHSLELRITADGSKCNVDGWKMISAHSKLEGSGIIENYERPVFKGVYTATVAGDDVGFLLKSANIPSGSLGLQGNLRYETLPGPADFIDGVHADGVFESAALAVSAVNSRVSVRKLEGHYGLENGQLRITRVNAELLQGRLHSDSNVIDLKRDAGSLQAELQNASLRAAAETARSGQRLPPLRASMNLRFAMNWKNGVGNALINAKATFSSGRLSPVPGDIPLDGVLDATYDVAGDQAVLRDSILKTGTAQLRMNGTLSKNSALNIRFASADLHELFVISAQNGAADFVQNAKLDELHGAATFDGEMTGHVRSPRLEGRLAGTQIVFKDLQLSSTRAHVILESGSLQIADGVIESNQGRVQLAATIPLSDWTPDKSGSFRADVKTERLSVAGAQRLASVSYPVQGLLSGELHLTGSMAAPAGSGHLELSDASIYSEPIAALSADFQADANVIRLEAQARAKAGTLHARGMYQLRARRYELSAEAQEVNLALLSLQTVSANQLVGTVSAEVSGAGTLDAPQLHGTMRSSNLQVRGETFNNLQLQIAVEQQVAKFELSSVLEQSQIAAKGTVGLTGNYMAKVTVDTGKINISPFLQRYLSGAGASAGGVVEVHATGNGPLKDPAQIQGHIEIPTLQLTGKNLNLANAQPIQMDYAGGLLNIRSASLQGAGTDFSVKGTVPFKQNGALGLSASGNVDVKILQDWAEGSRAAGQAKLQLEARGTMSNPDISGNIQITNVGYSSDSMPVGLESLNGNITIQGKRLKIAKLAGAAGGGTINIGGSMDFGENPTYALTLNAQSARMRQNGIRAVVDADLTLHGSGGNQALDGRVVVHKLSFNEGSDLGEIIAQLSGNETISEPSAFAKKTKINVSVQSDEGLALASSQLSVSGAANVRVVGTVARPVLLGRVSLTGGEVFFLGKRFELQSGTIGFANTAQTRPIMNLYVRTTIEQYNITISLSGPLEKLKTTYTSDPALPTGDIINLLAFGQTTTEAASRSSAPASVGAESAVASAVGGQLAGQLQKVSGISQLTIDPLAGNNQNPGAQIAIQQRVTGNLLITFSTDITSAQSQSIQLKYQAKRNVSISILRDENGGYGMDVRYHKAF
ncbi:MAG TPA: translocation/assembly module TamB domain-containing protein [Candidatus Saccharimonadales bacterium]|nr:translocation/assembly module TamB domain-containing protein [Candidatus Saccharimonadales bacterium]